MTEVTIYTTRICPYCLRAKHILDSKGVNYSEIAVDGQPALRAEMEALSGQRTVPQIWIGERHIGGCTDLMALDYQGELDSLLGGPAAAPE